MVSARFLGQAIWLRYPSAAHRAQHWRIGNGTPHRVVAGDDRAGDPDRIDAGRGGGPTGAPAHLHPSTYGIISSVRLTFFAYAGYGMMPNAAAGVPHPARTIPRAIYVAIAVVTVLYAGLAVVVLQSVSPAELSAHADTAVAQAARPVLGYLGFVAVRSVLCSPRHQRLMRHWSALSR
jgi:amino acid transporter